MPPRDMTAGDPAAAAALRRGGLRLRVRALEAALDLDPTLKDRHSELVREGLLSDSPSGIRVTDDGRVVSEGLLSDTPAGYRINEKGELIREGLIDDTPTGITFKKELGTPPSSGRSAGPRFDSRGGPVGKESSDGPRA
jgi:hypothetical protein